MRDFSKLENEIFGFEHDKVTNFIGSLEEAVGGTLFLKNIDKMNKKMQGKFLRVFEEKKFYRVGGASSIKTDFRIISSSNYSIMIQIWVMKT